VFDKSELIKKNQNQMDQKVRILAFLDLVFHKDESERILSFEEIANTTQVGADDVELLLMKGMSIGLFKGIIDQVDQNLKISWIKPRLLSIRET
jgi:26S proteasome regulatory subunit N9